MIVLNILGYFGRNKQNSYAALINSVIKITIYKLHIVIPSHYKHIIFSFMKYGLILTYKRIIFTFRIICFFKLFKNSTLYIISIRLRSMTDFKTKNHVTEL